MHLYPGMSTTDKMIEETILDPCTSHWLRDALKAAMQRDPLDACEDAKMLAWLMGQRVKEEGWTYCHEDLQAPEK